MNNPEESGGTPINRLKKNPQQQAQQVQQVQQVQQQAQQVQQQRIREPVYTSEVEEECYEQAPVVPKFKFTKKQSVKFLDQANSANTRKYAILVSVIFILLNSKIIWKQILKLPLMGQVEPSIVALIVNSLLAGLVFYIASKYLI